MLIDFFYTIAIAASFLRWQLLWQAGNVGSAKSNTFRSRVASPHPQLFRLPPLVAVIAIAIVKHSVT